MQAYKHVGVDTQSFRSKCKGLQSCKYMHIVVQTGRRVGKHTIVQAHACGHRCKHVCLQLCWRVSMHMHHVYSRVDA